MAKVKAGTGKKSTTNKVTKNKVTKKKINNTEDAGSILDVKDNSEQEKKPVPVPEPEPIPTDIPGIIRYLIKKHSIANEDSLSSITFDQRDELLKRTDMILITDLIDGTIDFIVDDFIKEVFGELKAEYKNELRSYSTNYNNTIRYDTENDIVVVHKEGHILGESIENLAAIRDEYTEEKYLKMISNVALIGKKMGFKFVSLINQNMNTNKNSMSLTFTTTPDFDTHQIKDCVVFGKSYEISIPKQPLHPAKDTVKQYIDRGANPYSSWDNIFRDSVSNVVYAMSNKNNVLILIKRYYVSVIDLIACELLNGKDDVKKKTDEIYAEEKSGMLKLFTEKTQKELTQNYNDLKKDVDDGYKRLEELGKEFAKIGRAVKDAERDIKYFDIESMMKDSKDLAVKQFERLYKIPQVSLVQYVDGYIVVYTNNIYQNDKRSGKWHDMGTFKICISWTHKSFSQDSIKIYPTKWDNTSASYWSSHVFKSSNTMCLGNTTNAFAKNYANRDVFGVVFNVVDFLKSENYSDPASVSDKYPVVPESIAQGERYFEFKKEMSYNDLDPDLL